MYVSVKNFDYKSIISGNLNGETEEKRFAKFNGLSEKQIDLMIDERKATHPSKYVTFLSIVLVLFSLLLTSFDQAATLDHNEIYGQIQILTETKEYKQLNAKEQKKEIQNAIKKANKTDLNDTNLLSIVLSIFTLITLLALIIAVNMIIRANKELHELYTYKRILDENITN